MRYLNQAWVGAAVIAASFVGARTAVAADEGGQESGASGAGGASVSAGATLGGAGGSENVEPGAERREGAEAGEERETTIAVGLDLAIGFGKTAVVNQTVGGPTGTAPLNSIDGAPLNVESFLLGAGFSPIRDFVFGVRLPFTVGNFSPVNQDSRGTSALGNLELEGEYELELNNQLKLIPSLGLALPTAQGDEVPDSADRLVVDPNFGRIDQNAYDRFSLNHAAAAARGYEENALFEPKRFGIIPKVSLLYRMPSGLRIEPYVKLENLIDTTGNAADKYLGELVGALRVAYLLQKELEPGVRVWANVPVNGANTDPVGVVEPELRMHLGAVHPYAGVIIPFAGPIAKNPSQFVAIRLGLAARF